jgi:hypothetical protein
MQRKCSFRFLLVYPGGRRAVITQDSRRGRNIRTGCVAIPREWSDRQVLEVFDCSVTFRAKPRGPDRYPKYERAF